MFGFNAQSPRFRFSLAEFSNPIGRGGHRSLVRNHHLRAFHFFPTLRVIAHVGEKHTIALSHQQQPCAAGKAAEVANVGQVVDEQRVVASGRHALAQSFLTSEEIHC